MSRPSITESGYADTVRLPAEGERRLLQAVLEDGIALVISSREALDAGRRPTLAELEARDWMASTARDWLFSFESICQTLGVSPSAVRARYAVEACASRAVAPVAEQPRELAEEVEVVSIDEPGSPFLSIDGVAEILGISPHRVNALARAGDLPASKRSGHWVFDRAEVEAYANVNRGAFAAKAIAAALRPLNRARAEVRSNRKRGGVRSGPVLSRDEIDRILPADATLGLRIAYLLRVAGGAMLIKEIAVALREDTLEVVVACGEEMLRQEPRFRRLALNLYASADAADGKAA